MSKIMKRRSRDQLNCKQMTVYGLRITFNLDFTTEPLLSEHKALKACQMLFVAFFNNNAMFLFTEQPISAATGDDSHAAVQYFSRSVAGDWTS